MNNIKRLREQKGISVRDLGTATNINSGTISRMENGNQQVTDVYAVALADYFKVSLDNLLGREWQATKETIIKTVDFEINDILRKLRSYSNNELMKLSGAIDLIIEERTSVKDRLNNDVLKVNKRVFGFISRWQSARRFSELATEYGLTKLTLHSLRHYFATQCLNAGIAEKVTTAWLGHHDSKVAKEIYQHIKSDFESEQIEKLAKYRQVKK